MSAVKTAAGSSGDLAPPRPAHPGPGKADRREIRWTFFALSVTVGAFVLLSIETGIVLVDRIRTGAVGDAVELSVFFALVWLLALGSLVYQVARLGRLKRDARDRPATPADIEAVYRNPRPPALTILVPCDQDEPRALARTVMAAALMEYPDRRIALLIDDPPDPADPRDRARLAERRRLPGVLFKWLRPQVERFDRALVGFLARRTAGLYDARLEARSLAELYEGAADWLEREAETWQGTDPAERFYGQAVLGAPARRHRRTAAALRDRSVEGTEPLDRDEALAHYRRLAGLFRVEVSCFERKRFANLSHEPDRAMNLNSYIGLVGGRYRFAFHASGTTLVPCFGPDQGDIQVPHADYLMILGADSMVRGDYALHLVHELERPENRRVAVIQSPDTAYPGGTGPLERAVGAATDIRHDIHQGYAAHGAGWWTGANALIRREALEDIAAPAPVGVSLVRRFLNNRSGSAEAESGLELIRRGWRILASPSRYVHSAAPADFATLALQRQRDVSGGLLNLAGLPGSMGAGLRRPGAFAEIVLRTHHLVYSAVASIALLALLLFPFEDGMRLWSLPLIVLPFVWIFGRDLCAAGYRWTDVPRVYALEFMLIPANLFGVARALRQGLTGQRPGFIDPPHDALPAGAPAHLGVLVLLVGCAGIGVADLATGRWAHAAFALINAGALACAVTRFVGWRHVYADIAAGWRARRPRLAPARTRLQEPGIPAGAVPDDHVARARAAASIAVSEALRDV